MHTTMAPDSQLLTFLLLLSSTTILTSSLSPTITTIFPTKSPSAPTPTTLPKPTPKAALSPAHTTQIIPPSTPTPTTTTSTLDPKQLRALQSLNIPTSKDPCSPSFPFHNTTTCDSSKPFRHLLSLRLSDCSDDVSLSITALKSLSSLLTLQFFDCPISPVRFPSRLTSNLHSFTCINSLKRLTGVWLSRMHNLSELKVSGVNINSGDPSIFLSNMKFLQSVTISNANLSGFLPKHWHLNLTHIDLSGNNLKGRIPSSISLLQNLVCLSLSSNTLVGEIPNSFGDLLSLQNLSLASNSLSGSIPDSMAAMPDLVHLDLASNQLNGTIPKFISEMKRLKFLNLERNNFQGVLPFNASFIKKLVVFKIGENANLCYNHSTFATKVKLGIAPCNKHGMPMSPLPAKDSSTADTSSGSSDDDYSDEEPKTEKHNNGPSKVVLGVAVGLSSVFFLLIFLVLLSRCCG